MEGALRLRRICRLSSSPPLKNHHIFHLSTTTTSPVSYSSSSSLASEKDAVRDIRFEKAVEYRATTSEESGVSVAGTKDVLRPASLHTLKHDSRTTGRHPFLSMQFRLFTLLVTPENSSHGFPSELLSNKAKGVITPDRIFGRYEDLVTRMTNFHNEDKGLMVLAGDVFDVPIRKDIVQRVVRWQLAKRQQGTHSTKTISEVSGTGRKPWKQKGTGRARHGSLRGPQFRGGATKHGPKPRSHAIKLQKKVRRLGLKIALSARAAEGKLLVFDDLEVPTHKTKDMVSFVAQMENTKKVLLVDGGPIEEKLKLATQNLHYVNVLPSIGLNVYSILQHDTLVMSRDAVDRIVTRMHTPINR